MFNLDIKTIPHSEQRYNTVGDYYYAEDGTVVIRVSDMGDRWMEFLIALHELIELFLCEKEGVTIKEIDEFDIAFTEERQSYDSTEPGIVPQAPYYNQHRFASSVERILATVLRVDWTDYERRQAECMANYKSES